MQRIVPHNKMSIVTIGKYLKNTKRISYLGKLSILTYFLLLVLSFKTRERKDKSKKYI